MYYYLIGNDYNLCVILSRQVVWYNYKCFSVDWWYTYRKKQQQPTQSHLMDFNWTRNVLIAFFSIGFSHWICILHAFRFRSTKWIETHFWCVYSIEIGYEIIWMSWIYLLSGSDRQVIEIALFASKNVKKIQIIIFDGKIMDWINRTLGVS